MKILFAATPIPGHLNPLLAIARMALARGDEAIVATTAAFESATETIGARFLRLAPDAGLDFSTIVETHPDWAALPLGPAKFQLGFERMFLDPMNPQAEALRAAIAAEKPDAIVTDTIFMGRAALFLDPDRRRVPLVSCGISGLPLDRPDGALFLDGLPPARDEVDRARYRAMAATSYLGRPIRDYADGILARMGLPPLPCSVMASGVLLADAYLHPTVPAFEYDYGEMPANLHFVGALPPPPPRDDPLPDWWGELDGGRPVVLVTQGTVANADFGELVEPTLAALADRDDLLVVVTTGGRPVGSIRGPIPANARLAEFLDYGLLLPKLSALVTNGGYGTVSLALRAGVPIVAAGRGEDKAEIGARVAWSGVGIEIPKQRPSVEDLRDAVGRVLSDPSYRTRAQAMAADMAAIDTQAEILGVLDGLVARFGGSARE